MVDIPHSPDIIISCFHPMGTLFTVSAPDDVTWPAINRAYYEPVRIYRIRKISRFWICNDSAVSGNFIIGLYDAEFNKITDTGSVAQAGTNTIQEVAVTAFELLPSTYYLALTFDNTAAHVGGRDSGIEGGAFETLGIFREALAGFAMPAIATPTAMITPFDKIPLFGMAARSFV